jgi:hypothetical protein
VSEHTIFVPVIKTNKARRIITGVVLEPDTFDAQNTVIKAKVIEEAAHDFMVRVNKSVGFSVQHEDFKKKFQLLESYIAPQDLVLGSKVVKSGSWVVSMKVISKSVWKKIEEKKIKGFSIGGKATIKKLED